MSIVATYGGVSNGATLTVGPQPLRAIITVNARNSYPCGIASDGSRAQYVDVYPCSFDASASTGDPVLFGWYVRSSVRKQVTLRRLPEGRRSKSGSKSKTREVRYPD